MERKMKSSIWKIGVVLAMLLSVFTLTKQEVKAETPEIDFTFDLGGGFIVRYNGNETDIVIPSIISGQTVRGIARTAFTNNTTVKSVTIPSSVTTIESGVGETGAFSGCTALEIVTIPGNVPKIGKNAFYGCSSLKTIDNTTPITSLEEQAFAGCTKLSNINLGKLTVIDHRAFADCVAIPKEKIVFDDSLASIGDGAFNHCSQLTEITLPNSLKTIGTTAFQGCSLQYITLPDSVETVGVDAFANQKSTGVYTVKNGVSTYTFPIGMDVSKVTTSTGEVTIDSTNRTATSTNPLTSFQYTYTATNSNSVSAPVTVTMTLTKSTLVDAVTPTITNDLSTSEVKVVKDTTASPLNATATVSDGGTITYQWYSSTTKNVGDGTIIDGATNETYTPPTTTVGTTYYYCVVTNENNSVTGDKVATTTSNVAMITVEQKVDAAVPVITKDLSETEVKVLKDSDASALDATSSVSDNGVVSYQWYSSKTNNMVNGTIIDGATNATYTPSTSTAGTTYYYCVVTNTNNNVNGIKTSKTTSKVAMITVTKKVPTMIEGQGQSTYKGEEEELLFVSSADFTEFMEVQVDNQKIDPSCYKAEAGSIRITLKPEYLKTLALGEHVLSIVATSGDVETTFVIKAREVKPQDPTVKPEEPNKPSDTGNAGNAGNTSNPTETKKEVTNTSDTSASMIELWSMLVLAGATMLGLKKKKNFE